ncbi:MAG: PEP-CTERM sorting domain-containing protein [Proteobacteria bacterium]|nr:PEP-CTERM sorting domain-containing protein [Pseudomonadota bacterium]
MSSTAYRYAAPGAGLGDSSAMKVTLDTATAGTKSGTAVVNFVSDGAGTSELGQTALGAGLAAGGADNLSLNVALDTSAAGIFSGTALIALSSHNADMSDLSLAPALVALSAQVNEFANPLLAKTGGDGSFGVNGFGAATLAAGDAHNLAVVLDTLVAGNFQDVFTLNLFSANASGFDRQIGSLSVTLKGVVTPAAVPAPGAVWLLGSALAGLVGLRRRKAV